MEVVEGRIGQYQTQPKEGWNGGLNLGLSQPFRPTAIQTTPQSASTPQSHLGLLHHPLSSGPNLSGYEWVQGPTLDR